MPGDEEHLRPPRHPRRRGDGGGREPQREQDEPRRAEGDAVRHPEDAGQQRQPDQHQREAAQVEGHRLGRKSLPERHRARDGRQDGHDNAQDAAPPLSGSGMSRMARTTLRRLTRQEEIRTTANVSTMPMQKARITFWGLVEKTIRNPSLPPAKPWPRKADHHPAHPDAGDAADSARPRGRRGRPRRRRHGSRFERCIPTARAMPSSCLRSAASITKIRKMRSIPAATENCPKRTKRVEKISPWLSARSIASFFTGSASRSLDERTGLISSTVASVYLPPSTAGPPCVIEDLVDLALLPDELLRDLRAASPSRSRRRGWRRSRRPRPPSLRGDFAPLPFRQDFLCPSSLQDALRPRTRQGGFPVSGLPEAPALPRSVARSPALQASHPRTPRRAGPGTPRRCPPHLRPALRRSARSGRSRSPRDRPRYRASFPKRS